LIYAFWHPIKDVAQTKMFYSAFAREGVKRVLRLELGVGGDPEKLNRTGLVVVNPPFGFEGEARTLLAFLAKRLARGEGHAVIETIAGE